MCGGKCSKKGTLNVLLRMSAGYVALCGIVGVSVCARTWHVPDRIGTIKEAVEYWASYGDTVLVAAGIYDTASGEEFPITIYESGIALVSESGPLVTIIDAQSTGRVFTCEKLDSNSVIAGFTIKGGTDTHGGGIYCDGSTLEINGNIIKGNSASRGGGIYSGYGAPRVINNEITENESPNYCGGGIYFYYSTGFIEGNKISENIATWGGGVFNDHSSPTIAGNFVERNRSRDSGAGLDCYMSSSPLITGNVVIGNIAGSHGAGIACCYDCAPTITRNTIVCNAGNYGGGIRTLGNSSPAIRQNIIVDNTDGVYLITDSGIVTATDNHVYMNTHEMEHYEVINNTSHILDLRNNFWWVRDSSAVDSLVYGPGRFTPFRTSLNDSIPGEPRAVTSVTLMADQTYENALTGSVQTGETLYVELRGTDWNGSFIEPALVIISSRKDPHGISVALVETGPATGVYRGAAEVRQGSNDSYNRIGVNEDDTIIVYAHIDPSTRDSVTVGITGVEEETEVIVCQQVTEFGLYQNCPNPAYRVTLIRYEMPLDGFTRLRVYDVCGRLIRTLVDEPQEKGLYAVHWDG
ncbi:hypothetical protein AMJ40_07670, partial [candidate division TA06 bacterium DG_26]